MAFDPGWGDATFALDANALIPRLGATGWEVLVEIARIHRSQFPERTIAALEAVPEEARSIGLRFLLPGEALPGDRCVP
ncbi:MAG: hypothetical protein ACRD2J_02390 [Thermoanaerobaculia bacterium]